jgi:hypothetical protein
MHTEDSPEWSEVYLNKPRPIMKINTQITHTTEPSPDWSVFIAMLARALKPYKINPYQTFLPELFLLMGGLDTRLTAATSILLPWSSGSRVKIIIEETLSALHSCADNLQPRGLAFISYRLYPCNKKGIGTFIFKASELTLDLIPQLEFYQLTYPEFFNRHRYSSAGVMRGFDEITAKYAISANYIDAAAETILTLIQRSLLLKYIIYRQFIQHFHNKNILPLVNVQTILDFCGAPHSDISSKIVSTTSTAQDNPTDFSYTQLCTTVPLSHAKHLQNYFNESVPYSSYANPDSKLDIYNNNALLTVVNVKHTTFFQPKLLRKFEEVLFADESKKLADYQRASRPEYLNNDAPNTSEKLARLEAVKRDLLTRSSVFRSHLLRIANSPQSPDCAEAFAASSDTPCIPLRSTG